MAGLCLARELALGGCSVTVLADPLASTATRAATGLLQLAGGRISRLHLALRHSCMESYQGFLDSLPLTVALSKAGHLRLGKDLARLESFASTLRGLGLQARALSLEQAHQLEPSLAAEVAGAVLLEDGGKLDPEALLASLTHSVGQLGVQIHEACIIKLRPGAASDVHGQTWRADSVIAACGAGLVGLLPLPWSLRTEEGWGACLEGSLPLTHSLELPELGQTLVPLSARRWRVAAGASWSATAPFQGIVPWSGMETRTSFGVRCAAPDGLPIAGRLEDGVFVLGGLARNGLLTAPLLARGLAKEVLTGTCPDWLKPFSPLRAEIGRKRSWSR